MSRKALLGRLSDVDFRLLRVFHSVVSCGGVSAAAFELNIGRSTISRHLTALEYRLGVKLCNRGPSGFALTQEGERIYASALQLFSAIHDFQASVDETHQRLTGHLAIAFFDRMTTNPNAFLPATFAAFEELAPDVTIEANVEQLNAIETGVLNGRFQVGIVPTIQKSDNLEYLPLYAEDMYLYCGYRHPLFNEDDLALNPDDIAQHKYAGFAFQSPNMVASQGWKLERTADVNNEEAAVMLILSGRYIGFLPNHYASHYVQLGKMRPIRPDIFHYESQFSAITRLVPKMPRRVEKFLGCLLEAHGKKP